MSVTTKLKPTREQQDLWASVAGAVEYGRSAVAQMRIYEVDAVPEPDAKGRRKVDGFQISWEASIVDGKTSPRPAPACPWLTVSVEWSNLFQALHGAAAAWIVDT